MPQIRESKKFIEEKREKKKRNALKCFFFYCIYIGCVLILFITFYVNLIKPLTVPYVCSRPFFLNLYTYMRPHFIFLIFIACAFRKQEVIQYCLIPTRQ